jgi:hypothetical protein
VAGIVLIALGLLVIHGVGGTIVAIVGLVPLLAGLFDFGASSREDTLAPPPGGASRGTMSPAGMISPDGDNVPERHRDDALRKWRVEASGSHEPEVVDGGLLPPRPSLG